MKYRYITSVILFCFTFGTGSFAQKLGSVSGNIESIYQYLLTDSIIGATQPKEKSLINTYALVNYNLAGFKAGARFEVYYPRILGYPDRYDGAGLGYRYVGYENKLLSVTVGNFYEQFGSGLIFRSYEDRALGVDNAMDGFHLRLTPVKGLTIKGVYGKQRFSFTDGKVVKSAGIVRGFDGELAVDQLITKLSDKQIRLKIGGSFVSKYESGTHPDYNIPANVGAYGGRIDFGYKNFYLNGEYVIKEADPSADNNYIFNYGKGMIVNLGYSQKGIGVLLSAKSIDNMSFRSERNAALQDLTIGFIPPLTKTHTYNLVTTLYPYVSQPLGEVAYQADFFYKFKRGTKLGGKYGMDIALNFSTAFAPEQTLNGIDLNDSSRVVYSSRLFHSSYKRSDLYWRDINIEVKRKLSKKWSFIASYYNIHLNNDVIKITDAKGIIESHIGVIDVLYKINTKHSIRGELQGLWTKGRKDRGHWATLVLEYTISPDWFFSFVGQYNYGHPDPDLRVLYPIGVIGKIWGSTRLQVAYGRQNAGLFCVGGVCRFVPASNGLTVTFTHSF